MGTAIGYRLVRDLLEQTFGEIALQGMRRMTPDGPGTISLARELTLMEALFNGAYVTTMRELGLTPDPKLAAGRTGGADAFYKGPVADEIVKAVASVEQLA